VWPAGGIRLGEFERATREATFAEGVGLPGRIWKTREPQWVSDVAGDLNFPRAPLAREAGLHGAFAFPIRLGEQMLGVVEFFSREIRQPNGDILEMFSGIGGQMGQFIERKRAENAIRELNADLERRVADATRDLRESQERFSKAFQASPAFLSIARMSDGQFVEVNESFLQSSGYTREEVIGRSSGDLRLWPTPADRERFLREVKERGVVRHREVVLRSKKGRLDTVLLSAERIDIDRQPHILEVGLDITTRKQAEEDMRRALEQEKELSRLKTNFVTLVSHEFRTPLGVIMSAADILKNYFDRLPAGRRVEHLRDIHDASRRMGDLMDEVLLLARVEAGRMECRPTPLDLREFCAQVTTDVRVGMVDACPIALSTSPGMEGASGDESLLRHIFTNLLSNAVKYSNPGSVVQFKVARTGAEAVFVVRDRGLGIPKADQSQLFLTFHRGSNVGERPGTGLGLVIVKRCVELHGGTIDLQSKEGEGTTVTVRLPLFAEPGSNGTSTRGRRRPRGSKPGRPGTTRKKTTSRRRRSRNL
jgi:PAS domain S-box-containing protein